MNDQDARELLKDTYVDALKDVKAHTERMINEANQPLLERIEELERRVAELEQRRATDS